MFESAFSAQLRKLVDQEVRVTAGERLYIGQVSSVSNFVLTLVEASEAYERETMDILIPLSQVSYVQVDV